MSLILDQEAMSLSLAWSYTFVEIGDEMFSGPLHKSCQSHP